MFELFGQNHNDIDGSYCYGYLEYVGVEYGSYGEICSYRCPQCGREIRHVEAGAAGLGCKSVAFPLLGAGTYGFPKPLAMQISLSEIQDFLLTHEEGRNLEVSLVVYDGESMELASRVSDGIEECIGDDYLRQNERNLSMTSGDAAESRKSCPKSGGKRPCPLVQDRPALLRDLRLLSATLP